VRVVAYGEVTSEILRRSLTCLERKERGTLHWDGHVGEYVPISEDLASRMTDLMARRVDAYLDALVGDAGSVISLLARYELLGRTPEEMLNVGLRGMLLDLSVGRVVSLRNLLGIDRRFYVLSLPDRKVRGGGPPRQYGVRFFRFGVRWLARLWLLPGPSQEAAPGRSDLDALLRIVQGDAVEPEEAVRLRYYGLADACGEARLMWFGDRMDAVCDALATIAERSVAEHVEPLLAEWDDPAARLAQLRIVYEVANDHLADFLPQYRDVLEGEIPVCWWLWQGRNRWVSALEQARSRSAAEGRGR